MTPDDQRYNQPPTEPDMAPAADQPTVTMPSPFGEGDVPEVAVTHPDQALPTAEAPVASLPPQPETPTAPAPVAPPPPPPPPAPAPASDAYRVSYGAVPQHETAAAAQNAATAPPPPPPPAAEPQLPPTQPTVAAPPPLDPGYAAPPPTQPYQQQAYQQQAYQPPAPPTGDPRYTQTPPPGYDPAATQGFAPAPPPPQYPPVAAMPAGQPPRRGRTALIAAGVVAIILLLLGAAAAVILTVTGSDKGATADTVAATSAAVTQNTVTVTKTQTSTSAKKSSPSKSSTSAQKSSPKSAPAPIGPSAAERATLARAQIKAMIRRHFQNIVNGNYVSAYNDLAPSASTASQSSWIQQIRDDGLYSFNVNVSPQLYSTTSGVANILSFHTEADASGCKDWSGSWTVVRSSGEWKIGKSNLSQTVVSCGE
jgi:hypothetical protein